MSKFILSTRSNWYLDLKYSSLICIFYVCRKFDKESTAFRPKRLKEYFPLLLELHDLVLEMLTRHENKLITTLPIIDVQNIEATYCVMLEGLTIRASEDFVRDLHKFYGPNFRDNIKVFDVTKDDNQGHESFSYMSSV